MIGEYKNVLRDAWQFTKRNRFMWWFGFFAALLGGNGGEWELLIRNFADFKAERGLLFGFTSESLSESWDTWQLVFTDYGVWAWVGAISIIIIALFLIYVIMVSQAGLVYDIGKKLPRRALIFDNVFQVGREYVRPTFWLNVISKAVTVGLFVLIALPFIYALGDDPDEGLRAILDITNFVVMVPIAIIVSFLLKYALAFVVLKKQSIGQAIRHAWKLFISNWVITLEMAFLIFILNSLVGIASVAVIMIFGLPVLFLSSFLVSAGFVTAVWILLFVAAFVFMMVLFVAGSAFSTFQWAVWVHLFNALTTQERESIVLRWIRRFFPRLAQS